MKPQSFQQALQACVPVGLTPVSRPMLLLSVELGH